MVKSPLGAIGAILVLIQAISASALFAIGSASVFQTILQAVLVGVIGLVTLASTTLVIWLVYYLVVKLKRPGLLFDPSDFDPAVQLALYVDNPQSIVAKVDST